MKDNIRERYPLNSLGDFYVENGLCISCTAPEQEAPGLMSHDPHAPGGYHCYFMRQPATPEETQRAVMAVAVACCGAVRYGGMQPSILQQLTTLGVRDACDHLA